MDSSTELDFIDKQINNIKNNTEYQRLLTSNRDIKNGQRLKAFSLQLQTLNFRRAKIVSGESVSNRTSNGRIKKSLRKPAAPEPKEQKQTEIKKSTPLAPTNIKKSITPPVVAPAVKIVPKGRTKPIAKISTLNRTIVRDTEPVPTEPENKELLIKPVRTSIKSAKIPISKLPAFHAARKAKTVRQLGIEQQKQTISSMNPQPSRGRDNIEIQESINIYGNSHEEHDELDELDNLENMEEYNEEELS